MILPSVYPESPSITFIQKIFIIVIFSEHNSNHTATTVKKSSLPWHPDPPINICKCTPVNRNSHSPPLFPFNPQCPVCCGLLVLSYISHTMLCFANSILSSETFLWNCSGLCFCLMRPCPGHLPGVCELPLLRTIYCLVCIPFKTHITHYFAFSCYDVVTVPLPCWKLRLCQKGPLTRHSGNPEQPLSTSGHAQVARNLPPWQYFLGAVALL